MPEFAANYLTVSPSGAVGAAFTGKLSALGIDIGSDSTGSSPNPDKSIQWHAGAVDGPIVGREYAQFGASDGFRFNDTLSVAIAGSASSRLTAKTVDARKTAELLVQSGNTGSANGAVFASITDSTRPAANGTVEIISQDGASTFLKMEGFAKNWTLKRATSGVVAGFPAATYGGPIGFTFPGFNVSDAMMIPVVNDGGSAAAMTTSIVPTSFAPLSVNVFYRNNGTAACNFSITLIVIGVV